MAQDDYQQILNDTLGENVTTSSSTTTAPAPGSNNLYIGLAIVLVLSIIALVVWYVRSKKETKKS